ncbi:MAG: HAD-IB family hydrolase [Spirochaetes bacterium]|nr:HAD-IB family hydrolase [Spirochaetota bacterium]
MRLALFDFDGTITTRDSLGDFLLHTCGALRCAAALIMLAPVLALRLAGKIPNWKAKEAVFRHFLEGCPVTDFAAAASDYAANRLPRIIRKIALERIEWHRSQGHRAIIVSASPEQWIKPWCGRYGMEVIATRLEIRADILTGGIDGANCYGEEKARRIRETVNLAEYEYIYAYGDSKGDTEMLSMANERYYNWTQVTQ